MPRKTPPPPDVLGDERLVGVDAIALALSLSRGTVYTMLRRGDIPAYRLSAGGFRVRVGDLREYVEAHTFRVPAKAESAA